MSQPVTSAVLVVTAQLVPALLPLVVLQARIVLPWLQLLGLVRSVPTQSCLEEKMWRPASLALRTITARCVALLPANTVALLLRMPTPVALATDALVASKISGLSQPRASRSIARSGMPVLRSSCCNNPAQWDSTSQTLGKQPASAAHQARCARRKGLHNRRSAQPEATVLVAPQLEQLKLWLAQLGRTAPSLVRQA